MPADDWTEFIFKVATPVVSGVGGILIGLWKWGRSSAEDEQAVKDDYESKIYKLRDELRAMMEAHSQKADSKNDLLVEQFKEAFDGIRRQIDEHRFYTEKDFVKKEDFRYFLAEYREDMRDLKASIASITAAKK